MKETFIAVSDLNSQDRGEAYPAADVAAEQTVQLEAKELVRLLHQDRLWLLRQIDSGLWPEWRLDLAALEREMGHLLDQATERIG